ncbi:MAG: hypothetical protein ACK4YU_12130 [Paracoccus sp. (in: a-proteobacteria)]
MKTWDAIMLGTVAVAGLLLAGQVLAQGADGVPGDRLVVPLPDVSALSEPEARDLTRELAEANVISDNCPDFAVTDGEWQLLNGTSDELSAQLGLDPLAYDREYFRPAFNLLDDPQACETRGPEVAQVVERLVAMGGSTQPDLPEPAADTPAETPTEDDTPAPAE